MGGRPAKPDAPSITVIAAGSAIQWYLLVDPLLGLKSVAEIGLLLLFVPEDLPTPSLRVFPNDIAVVFGLAHNSVELGCRPYAFFASPL